MFNLIQRLYMVDDSFRKELAFNDLCLSQDLEVSQEETYINDILSEAEYCVEETTTEDEKTLSFLLHGLARHWHASKFHGALLSTENCLKHNVIGLNKDSLIDYGEYDACAACDPTTLGNFPYCCGGCIYHGGVHTVSAAETALYELSFDSPNMAQSIHDAGLNAVACGQSYAATVSRLMSEIQKRADFEYIHCSTCEEVECIQDAYTLDICMHAHMNSIAEAETYNAFRVAVQDKACSAGAELDQYIENVMCDEYMQDHCIHCETMCNREAQLKCMRDYVAQGKFEDYMEHPIAEMIEADAPVVVHCTSDCQNNCFSCFADAYVICQPDAWVEMTIAKFKREVRHV